MNIPISIVCEYTLLRENRPSSDCEGEKTFHKNYSSGRTVTMVLSYETGILRASMEGVQIDEVIADELRGLDRFQGDKMTEKCARIINEPLNEIRESTRLLLSTIKYHLRHYDFKESLFSLKSEKWRIAQNDLRDIPMTLSLSSSGHSTLPLNAESQVAIQSTLDAGIPPLAAMRHLHRAKHESMSHHKWIDATIAAELAIKEVLCRAKPEIAPLLLELPSPPMSKLYGPLLKTYLGTESPYKNKLQKGQEMRNRLVHRPEQLRIDDQEANDYITMVETSIFHLLSLLYPDDYMIKNAIHLLGPQ